MKFYSKLKIDLISILLSVVIYFLIVNYIPQVFKTTKSYIYYKTQPNLEKEYYEEQ